MTVGFMLSILGCARLKPADLRIENVKLRVRSFYAVLSLSYPMLKNIVILVYIFVHSTLYSFYQLKTHLKL